MNIRGLLVTSDKELSPVDRWRVKLPLEELQKHTDWDITYRTEFVDIPKSGKFDLEELLEQFYDIDLVFSSYYQNRMQYAFCKLVEAKAGTKFILDTDDDMYHVGSHNPYMLGTNQELIEATQRMLETATWVSTTNERYAEFLRSKRPDFPPESVLVLPNFISKKLHEHPKFDNGDRVKIGYFGGSSHYLDLNKSNFGRALQQVMRKHKNVDFELYGWWGTRTPDKKKGVIGSLIEDALPTTRTTYHKGARGEEWYDLFKTINLDIACGPLIDDTFNRHKSNIKWQESGMMGAAFIASDVGPYHDTIKNGEDGVLVKNTFDDWYAALEDLVVNTAKRKKIAQNAQKRVLEEFTLEGNWEVYKNAIERVVNGK